MRRVYEIVGKNIDGDWETIKDNIKTLSQAIKKANKINNQEWQCIDINLIIDDDLKETYDKNGKIR
jgi:hypothetical protein